MISCFPAEMAQSRRQSQCSDANCLVCSLKQKHGVPWVLLYSLGSLKFGSRSCVSLQESFSSSLIFQYSQFGSRTGCIQMAPLCGGLLLSQLVLRVCWSVCAPSCARQAWLTPTSAPGTGAGVPVQPRWWLPAFREAAGKSLPGNAPWSTRQSQAVEQTLALGVSMGFGLHAKDMGVGIVGSARQSRREGSHPSIACRSKNRSRKILRSSWPS